MQVYGTNALAKTTSTPAGRRSVSGGFAVASEGAQAAASAGAARTVTGIEALLALQGVEDVAERRKRAVKRARAALDALDALKLGLLSGSPDPAVLGRLQTTVADLGTETGDPRLDDLLAQIGLRVGVELAKAGLR